MESIKLIFQQAPAKLKLDFLCILFLSITNSLLEVFGFGMLIPIFNIVKDFDNFSIYLNENFHYLYFLKDLSQAELFKVSLFFFLAIFFLKYLNYFYLNKLAIDFSAKTKIFLTTKIFFSYTSKNYIFFKNKNSSILLRDIFIEVQAFCDRFILSLLNLIMEILLVVLVVIFLLFKETNLIISFIIYFIPLSAVFYSLIKKKLKEPP
jgi:hypothetical protein